MDQIDFRHAFLNARALGQYSRCVQLAELSLNQGIWDTDIVGFYVNHLCVDNRLQAALNCIRKARSSGDISGLLILTAAALLIRLNQLEQAAEELAKICRPNTQEIEHWSLLQGILCEFSGKHHDALALYTSALMSAQVNGAWLDEETTEPVYRPLVQHAVLVSRRTRRDLLFGLISDSGLSSAETSRISKAVSLYLGEQSPTSADLRKPSFLFIEDLPALQLFPEAVLPFLKQFRDATDEICDEFMRRAYSSDNCLAPVHQIDDPMRLGTLISGQHGAKSWSAFYFYRHGKRYDSNHELCPITSSLIEGSPLARIPGHSPEVCYSLLMPGATILPHVGVTNVRSVMHVPLIIPRDCALSINGHGALHWKKYQPFVFDDTFEHQAWNRSDSIRVVLLADIWNPYLQDSERSLVIDVISTIANLREIAEKYVAKIIEK